MYVWCGASRPDWSTAPPPPARCSTQINAVKEAFELVYPTSLLEVEGVEVESGVSCQVRTCMQAEGARGGMFCSERTHDMHRCSSVPPTPQQPFSDVETYRGALTRARNTATAWAAKRPGRRLPDFSVGLVRSVVLKCLLDRG